MGLLLDSFKRRLKHTSVQTKEKLRDCCIVCFGKSNNGTLRLDVMNKTLMIVRSKSKQANSVTEYEKISDKEWERIFNVNNT